MRQQLFFAAPLLLAAVAAAASDLDLPRAYRARRVSSYDTSGGNRDAASVAPKAAHAVADIHGAGRIVHI